MMKKGMGFQWCRVIAGFSVLAAFLPGCGDRTETSGIFWPKNRAPYRAYSGAISPKSHVTWSTGNHTAAPVPVGSIGPERYTRKLGGIVKNTDIAVVMSQAINDGVSVILVIGDGFGTPHMSLQHFADMASGKKTSDSFEYIMNRGACGLSHTYTHSVLVTDSAAAATALACGKKTESGNIGVGPDGRALESVLARAEKRGMKTGIVTDTRVTHATPAAFYGHTSKRDEENLIAAQLADYGRIEVILGGGARHFIPAGTGAGNHPLLKHIALDGKSKRKDGRDLVTRMNRSGYTVVCNRRDLLARFKNSRKLLGIFAAGHMNSRIDRDDEKTGEPSIVEMADAALGILSSGKKGFFLMIECGRLDYDSHSNDIGATIQAVAEMERVLATCLAYQKKRPSGTLLIFTGDHETGGPAFSYYTPDMLNDGSDSMWKKGSSSPPIRDFPVLLKQKRSLRAIFSSVKSSDELRAELRKNIPFAISDESADRIYDALGEDRFSE